MTREPWVPRPTRRAAWVIIVLGALVTAALTWPEGWSAAAWPVPTWSTFEMALRDRSAGLALVAATTSALAIPLSRTSIVDHPWAARGAVDRLVVPLITLVVATWLGAAISMVPRLLATLWSAPVGRPDVIGALGAVVSLAIWPSIGILARTVIGRAGLASLAAASVTLVCLFLPVALSTRSDQEEAFSALSVAPLWGIPLPSLGWQLDPTTGFARIALFTLAAGVLVVLVRIAGELPDRQHPRVGALALAALPVFVAVGGMIALQPPLVVRDETQPLCEPVETDWTVCVHPTLSRLLPDIEAPLSRLLDLTGDTRSGVVLGWGVPVPLERPPQGSVRVTDLPALTTSRETFVDGVAVSLARGLTGWQSCLDELGELPPHADIPLALSEATGLQDELTRSLSARATGKEDLTSFAALSDEDLRTWMAEREQELMTCSLSEGSG